MLDKIKKNYLLMVKNYDKKHKSDHWNKFLNQSNLGKNKIDNLENFRKPKIFGNSLTHGLSDDFGFIPTLCNTRLKTPEFHRPSSPLDHVRRAC